MYELNDFSKSTPPQNCQRIVSISPDAGVARQPLLFKGAEATSDCGVNMALIRQPGPDHVTRMSVMGDATGVLCSHDDSTVEQGLGPYRGPRGEGDVSYWRGAPVARGAGPPSGG